MSKRNVLLPAQLEGLESRWLLSKPAPAAKFGVSALYFNDIAENFSGGSGPTDFQNVTIRNAGTLPVVIPKHGVSILGSNATAFRFTGKQAPKTIEPGATQTIPVQFTAAKTAIYKATLRILSNDPKNPKVDVTLRGLGTKGEGGDLEPSLQKVLDLFQIPVNVGDSNPNDTNFKVPASQPNDEVDLQQMVKVGTGRVTIEMLAAFVNDFSPAMRVGWYHPGQPEFGQKDLFTIPANDDSQSVNVVTSGKTFFDPGDKSFGIYTSYPAFSNRKSLSEDALNTWETKSQNRKKIRFYPLKNPDGSVVANAYVFAAEDFNQVYDFQDGVGIIRNVMPAPGGAALGIQNLDGSPGNDRVVFNRITNLDLIRPNKFHDIAVIDLINSGSSTLTVSSLKLSDGTNFKIISGGGSNFKISPHSERKVTIQFVAAPLSGVAANYASTLTVISNDPDEPKRVINLAGIWQDSSEKTALNKYSEPSLKSVITAFGYTTVITKPGETTNHKGKPVLVGDEILSAYWDQADLSLPINIRQLSAFHRQNNFDPVTLLPLTAASTLAWYPQGQPTQINKLFTHNIDEGQSLLPHLSGGTTKNAQGSFRQKDLNKPFGFVVDKTHYTDRTLNALDFNPTTLQTFPGTGHAFRIYPLKDANGKLVPNAYIFAMDYTANEFANWDYQDNIYLVQNVKPHGTSATPMAVAQRPAASLFSAESVKDQDGVGPSDLSVI